MFDGPLMLRVNWPVVDTIHPQSNKFATGVKIKMRQRVASHSKGHEINRSVMSYDRQFTCLDQ